MICCVVRAWLACLGLLPCPNCYSFMQGNITMFAISGEQTIVIALGILCTITVLMIR